MSLFKLFRLQRARWKGAGASRLTPFHTPSNGLQWSNASLRLTLKRRERRAPLNTSPLGAGVRLMKDGPATAETDS